VILVVDNYDSFTFNLVQALSRSARSGGPPERRDRGGRRPRMKPEALVVSPGPCTPAEAGISVPFIRSLSGTVPILGVCLGHQSIGAAFGGIVRRAGRVVHGKTSPVSHEGIGLFTGLPRPLAVGRYHSLVLDRATVPEVLEVTALSTDDGRSWPSATGRTPPSASSSIRRASSRRTAPALLRNFLEGRLGP
jgi:anthranilate synthase component 2